MHTVPTHTTHGLKNGSSGPGLQAEPGQAPSPFVATRLRSVLQEFRGVKASGENHKSLCTGRNRWQSTNKVQQALHTVARSQSLHMRHYNLQTFAALAHTVQFVVKDK